MSPDTGHPDTRHQDFGRPAQLLVGAMTLGLGWTLMTLTGASPAAMPGAMRGLLTQSPIWFAAAAGWVNAAAFPLGAEAAFPLAAVAWAGALGGLVRRLRRRFAAVVELALPVASLCRISPDGGYAIAFESDGQTVLAPAPGRIVTVIGETGQVVMRLANGRHVVLSRLRRHSIRVQPGQQVQPGDALGDCGGSGLRMQVQAGARPGGRSLAFRLKGAVTEGNGGPRWQDAALPEPDSQMRPATDDTRFDTIDSGAATFRVACTGRLAERFAGDAVDPTAVLLIARDAEGGFELRDAPRAWVESAPTGRLTLRAEAECFRATSLRGTPSPLLRCLAMAFAVVPRRHVAGMWWCVRPPMGLRRMRLAASFGTVDAAGASTLTLRRRSRQRGLPESLWLRLDRAGGVAELRAAFADGQLHCLQTGFAPAP